MIDEAIRLIAGGEVVGIPTDTVYGIAADPHSQEAVDRLFWVKGRNIDQPVGLLVASVDQAIEIVVLPGYALDWASEHWPGPLNLIARPRGAWPRGVGDPKSLAVRVPDHMVALSLLEAAGPLAVTSANRTSEPETLSDTEARLALGDDVAIYLPGVSPGGVASTAIDVRDENPRLLRRGPLDLG